MLLGYPPPPQPRENGSELQNLIIVTSISFQPRFSDFRGNFDLASCLLLL